MRVIEQFIAILKRKNVVGERFVSNHLHVHHGSIAFLLKFKVGNLSAVMCSVLVFKLVCNEKQPLSNSKYLSVDEGLPVHVIPAVSEQY